MENKKDPAAILNWIDQMCNIIANYSLWKVITSIVVLAFAIIMMSVAFSPGRWFDAYEKHMTTKHNAAIEYRMNNEPEIRNILNGVLNQTHAQRAFILEMRNGSNNISGLPFLYLDMKYEMCSDGVDYIDNDYQNVSMSRFPFVKKAYDNTIWHGTMEELSVIDKRLAQRMSSNDAKYMVIVFLEGSKTDIGFLGITYTLDEYEIDYKQIEQSIIKASQKLSILLDGQKQK